jgi:transcriptional regulator MraZ
MAFFTSEYTGKLDAKGRLVLPARMKANLPDTSSSELFMREGFDPCLELYPLIEYKKIYSKIAGLNEFNAEFRKLQRNFFRGSTTVELDSAGRLLIPKPMLQYAKLDKEIVVVGMGNRMEIWNPEEYEKFLINDPQELSELAEKHLTDHD